MFTRNDEETLKYFASEEDLPTNVPEVHDEKDIEDLEDEELETALDEDAEEETETRPIKITIHCKALVGAKLSDIELRIADLLADADEFTELESIDAVEE